MTRWKTVRDGYMRNLRKRLVSGQAAEPKRSYIFAKQLSFLQKTNTTASTDSTLGTPETELTQEKKDEEFADETPKKKTFTESQPRKRKKVEDALIHFMEAPIPVPNVSIANPTTTVEDDDKSFLHSLLPSLKSFSEDEKIEFRLNTLNCIKSIRGKRPTAQYYPYYPSHLQPLSGNQFSGHSNNSNYMTHNSAEKSQLSRISQHSQQFLEQSASSYVPQILQPIQVEQPLPSPAQSTSSLVSQTVQLTPTPQPSPAQSTCSYLSESMNLFD